MDALSGIASVIAIIQLTGSIVTICGGYMKEVKGAVEDITSLQREVTNLSEIVTKLANFINSQNGRELSISQIIANDAASCQMALALLKEKIDPANSRSRTKAMRKLGLRALQWPLKHTEIERIIQKLERYKSSFNLALQVDLVPRVIEISQTAVRIEQNNDLEGLPMALGAEFDSYMNQHESECLPGTRRELCHKIEEWAVSRQEKCIFWLGGLAGTGKSTISRTVAKCFQQQGLLGASFFFKRGEGDRGNATKLFPTLVRQLLIRCPELLPSVTKAIKDEPRLSSKPLKEQFQKLLLQPLQGFKPLNHRAFNLVIVIDALDECEDENDIRTILQLLPHIKILTTICLRVIVTSRPEISIRQSFGDIRDDCRDFILHQVPYPIIEHDISLFLKQKLVAVRRERSLSAEWPGDASFQTLVTMSVPLFIFAATICRLFQDHNLDPQQCLTDVLKYQNEESKLDGTYLPVLNRLLAQYTGARLRQIIQEVQEILGIIIMLKNPLSIASLSQLMKIPRMSVNARLNSLHSILNIPNDETTPIRIFHSSFRDFLLDLSTREKTPLWVDREETNQRLITYCISVMNDGLKKNMCYFPSYGTERRSVDIQSINHYLPPELQYSCRYWTHHLTQCKVSKTEIDITLAFLDNHFLHWVEAMSILGVVSEVLGAIITLQSVVQVIKCSTLSEFLHEAKRYILKIIHIADIAPLQLYASGLIFAPKTALIRKKFQVEIPDWLLKGPRVEENWDPEIQTLEGHSSSVHSVAFSSNGRLLASSSWDRTIKIWDPSTGILKHTLEGHSDLVPSIAFSLDDRLLASGSIDQTIKLWDPITGVVKHTLRGHSDQVWSVAFSSNGLLASGSIDKTIKLWDLTTGGLKHTIEDHSAQVYSVTFSPDGRLLVSGSGDQTIKVWDPATGILKYTLEGHSSGVLSVAFSSDNRLLASGSDDQSVKIWDPAKGILKYTLSGHSRPVWSVSFSSGSRLLASASWDRTIKLWDFATGVLNYTLQGHSDHVWSVAFSSDGQLLASGSGDQTIKLWDPSRNTIKHTWEDHSDCVQAIAFSLDGQLLVTGSNDRTIKLWDPARSVVKHTLEGHSNWINSVAVSPDGQLLASSSNDRTVRLWNPAAGVLEHTLEGHLGLVSSVAFSPDGRLLASGSWDRTIKLWDPTTGIIKHTLVGQSSSIQSVIFTSNSQLLASCSYSKIIELWDPATGVLKHHLRGPFGFSSISSLLIRWPATGIRL